MKISILCLLALPLSVIAAPIDRDDDVGSFITVNNAKDTPMSVASIFAHHVWDSPEPLTKGLKYIKLDKDNNQVRIGLRIGEPFRTMFARYRFTLQSIGGGDEIVFHERRYVQNMNHLCMEGAMVNEEAHPYDCKKSHSVKYIKAHLPTNWTDAEMFRQTVAEMKIEMLSAEGRKLFESQFYVWLV